MNYRHYDGVVKEIFTGLDMTVSMAARGENEAFRWSAAPRRDVAPPRTCRSRKPLKRRMAPSREARVGKAFTVDYEMSQMR